MNYPIQDAKKKHAQDYQETMTRLAELYQSSPTWSAFCMKAAVEGKLPSRLNNPFWYLYHLTNTPGRCMLAFIGIGLAVASAIFCGMYFMLGIHVILSGTIAVSIGVGAGGAAGSISNFAKELGANWVLKAKDMDDCAVEQSSVITSVSRSNGTNGIYHSPSYGGSLSC